MYKLHPFTLISSKIKCTQGLLTTLSMNTPNMTGKIKKRAKDLFPYPLSFLLWFDYYFILFFLGELLLLNLTLKVIVVY